MVTQNVFLSLADLSITLGCAILLVAAVHDIGTRTIPNWVPLCIAALGAVVRMHQHDLLTGFIVGGSIFLAAAFIWRRGWMGGGDVKLLGACALLVAPRHVYDFVTLVAFFGGGLALIYLLMARVIPAPRRPLPHTLFLRLLRAEQWRISRRSALPYGVAIVAGGVTTLLRG